MQRLWLRFDDDEFAGFRWAVADDDAERSLAWQAADEDALAEVSAQHPLPTVIVIPQQYVYLGAIDLPEKAGRQVIGAIEYQVEDRLAGDVEGQHVAIGDVNANPLPIAVVSRALMDRCVALAEARALRVTRILPELFLCPWDDEGPTLMRQPDGWLLRHDRYRGLKATDGALPAVIDLARQEADFGTLRVVGDGEGLPDLPGLEVDGGLESAAPGEVLGSPLIDLQQRDYQSSSAWLNLGRSWKWIALLMALLLVVGGYNRAIALQSLEAELGELREQQYLLLQPYLPVDTPADVDLKQWLIERLQTARANQRERDFLQLLDEFTRARAAHPGIDLERIGFQGDRLSLDISSAQLANMEALLAGIRARGIEARLENLNIKPELSAGRLVMVGGSGDG